MAIFAEAHDDHASAGVRGPSALNDAQAVPEVREGQKRSCGDNTVGTEHTAGPGSLAWGHTLWGDVPCPYIILFFDREHLAAGWASVGRPLGTSLCLVGREAIRCRQPSGPGPNARAR